MILEEMGVFTVDDLIEHFRFKLRKSKSIEKLSDKVITLRRGKDEVLDSKTSITGLYNTKDEALHITVGMHTVIM